MAYSERYYPNPDENFVLQGGRPFYIREKKGFLSNSMLTDTTQNLTQHDYNSKKYVEDPELKGSLYTISNRLNRVSNDIRKTLLQDSHHGFERNYTQQEYNEALREALNKSPPPSAYLSHLDWYSKPIHLSRSVNVPMTEEDMLATRYFPVTLGEAKSIEMVGELKPGKSKKSGSNSTKFSQNRDSGYHRYIIETKTSPIDDAYFLTAMAPHIKTAGILFTSPYTEEISKLRMEKLRMEEQQYLELKRRAELEKIRGPKPKWYELKTPEFHREAYKNNELLRNSDKWDELLHYRENLLNATNQLKTALDGYKVPVY